jgi:hypothetical protein
VSALEPGIALPALYASGLAGLGAGLRYRWRRRGAVAFALLAAVLFLVALAAVVAVVAPYVYAHPHHHCPFCILKAGHGFVGYWLYLPLFAATALALGVGAMGAWGRAPSLRPVVAAVGRRLSGLALGLLGLFYLVASYAIWSSPLTMGEVWW